MLWIALYLPELPMESAARGAPEDVPLVLSDGPVHRLKVCAANGAARAMGIAPDMALAAAQALCPAPCSSLRVMARDEDREQAALASLAGWAGQFTPTVSLEKNGLLLEVEASLALFGGLMPLLARLRRGVRELGFSAVPAVAPTPLAAWWLARARHVWPGLRSCFDPARLIEHLRPLDLTVLGWPEGSVSLLEGLGIRRLGACLDLPRDGFARRFGPELATLLDRALGSLPDPRPLFTPSESFSSGLELPAEVDRVEALQFPLRRLLLELEGFLRGRGAGVSQLELMLGHTGKRRTRVSLGLAAPERHASRLLALLRERLNRVELSQPVVSMILVAEGWLPFAAENAGLFPDGPGRGGRWRDLQERLHARLGSGRVHALRTEADHRPEAAWRAAPVLDAAGKAQTPGPGVAAPRPVWLLRAPRPLPCRDGTPDYHGPLILLQGPERIEAGWWDDRPAGRDYYVAKSRRGELLWVYRDHRAAPEWYLHGVFA
ncbi:MAG: DNA polymerase Y family protein [Rhodocyclaceae bacterium]|nr:DNA polymerase Y family protein [Rhodocyclaceae bacterium]